MNSSPMPSVKHYALIAAALFALLALTIGAAFLHLGPLNTPVALLLALLKATLIILFFMHVRRSSPLTRLFAVAGFFWLGILFVLTLGDYLTR